MRAIRLLLLTVLVGLAGACSGDVSFSIGGQSPEDAAVEVIEDELAGQLGLTLDSTSCNDIDDPEVGDAFPCTSVTADGDTVRWEATIESDEEIFVESRNVVRADAVPDVEAAAARSLAESVGQDLPAENFDCGDEVVVLDESNAMTCILTVPDGTGVQFDAVVRFTDLDNAEFDVEVADTPR